MNERKAAERASEPRAPAPRLVSASVSVGIAGRLFLGSDSRRARPCCELRDATGGRRTGPQERKKGQIFFVQVRTRRRRAKPLSPNNSYVTKWGSGWCAVLPAPPFAARTAPPAPGATPIGGVLCEREVQRLPPRVWRQLRPGRRAGRCGHRAHLGAAAARSPAARRTPYRVPYASAPPLRRRSLT